jgi:asparagine synthase (glutamine-hydrolysing)
MCGIAGLGQPGGQLRDPERIHPMLSVLHHRGPDGRGHWQAESAVLGATRLAIVDPEHGTQPVRMGPIVGVMNGQIYNHIPLRKELDARGQNHKTLCDTEVMVGLVAEVGLPKALERMDGMFALAVWDERDQSLHLARDRVGQKPLYWTQLSDGTIAFASELKGLLVLPGVARDLDPVALQQLLLFEFVPAPRSIYKGIHKLEPGTWLRADAHGLSIQRWWEPPLPGERRSQFGNSREKSLVAVHTAVNQAVGRRLPEGPLALLLSGGIDSSIVAHCAAERRPNLHSFSLGFKEESFDESGAARLVAEHLGLQHQVLHFGVEDFESTLAELAQGLCEPLADGSLPSTLRLAKAVAAQGYKVAIGGDGADEHFGGYPTYRAHQTLPGNGLPGASLLRRMGRRIFPEDGSRDLSFGTKFRRFGEGAGLAWARRNQVWMGAFLPKEIPLLLGTPLLEAVWEPVDRWAERVEHADPAQRAMFLDQRLYLAEGVLQKVDRAGMLAGLEFRAPFVDHHLVALAASLPPHLKLGPRRSKACLRDAFRKALPSSTLNRPKKGFGTPLGPWLQGAARPALEHLVERPGTLVNPEYLTQLAKEHWEGQADNRRRLWSLLLLETWRNGAWG